MSEKPKLKIVPREEDPAENPEAGQEIDEDEEMPVELREEPKPEQTRELVRDEFFIAMRKLPSVTAQEHRVISQGPGKKALFFDPPELAEARAKYIAYLSSHKPKRPAEGPVMLKVYWCYAATKKHPVGSWKTTRPDTDNMLKLFKDCMTKVGFWKDDAQVVLEVTGKRYDRLEGIYVHVCEIDEEEESQRIREAKRTEEATGKAGGMIQ